MINLSRADRVTDPSIIKDIPGPGYYSSPGTKYSKPSYIFGTSERAVSDLSSHRYEDIPGPGAYLSTSSTFVSNHKNPFNSSSARFQSYGCNWKPGPGAYHMDQKRGKKDQKIIQTLCIHPSPVPVSIPLLERHELAIYDGLSNKVSPAEYNPKYEKIKPKQPASLFSKSKLQRNIHKFQGAENLGPGCYNLDGSENSLQFNSVSKTERFKEAKSLSPGPGAYNPSILPTKPGQGLYISKLDRNFDIAKNVIQENQVKSRKVNQKVLKNAVFASSTERSCNKLAEPSSVGPGKYEYSPDRNDGFVFSHEPRFRDKEDSPVGPGTYDPPELSKRSSPISLKSPRFRETKDPYIHNIGMSKVPGPGNYDLREKKRALKALSFDMYSSRTIEHRRDHSPDPGQYHVESSLNSGPRIGAESRFKSGNGSYIQVGASGEFVGPGSYKMKSNLVKRTYNISWI